MTTAKAENATNRVKVTSDFSSSYFLREEQASQYSVLECEAVVARYLRTCASAYHSGVPHHDLFERNERFNRSIANPMASFSDPTSWEERQTAWIAFRSEMTASCQEAYYNTLPIYSSANSHIGQKEQLRQRVISLLTYYDLKRVGDTDKLLEANKNKEEAVLKKLVDIYGPEPTPEQVEAKKQADGGRKLRKARSVRFDGDIIATARQAAVDLRPVDNSLTFVSGSFVSLEKGVFFHVWTSNQEARRYINGYQRLWQAIYECRLDCVGCPFSSLTSVQGVYVTSTTLVPLPSTKPVEWPTSNDGRPSTFLLLEQLGVLKGLLRMPLKGPRSRDIRAYVGNDMRLYLVDPLAPLFSVPKFTPSGEIVTSTTERRLPSEINDVARLELFADEDTGDAGTKTAVNEEDVGKLLRSRISLAVAIRLTNEVEKYMNDAPEGSSAAVIIDAMLKENIVPKVLHSLGVNLRYLYLVERSIAANVAQLMCTKKERTAANARLLLYHEMVSRSVKEVIRAELWNPKHVSDLELVVQRSQAQGKKGNATRQVVDDFRLNIVTACMQRLVLTISKEENDAFESQIMPVLRHKFAAPDSYKIPQQSLNSKVIMAAVNARLGAAFDAAKKKFVSVGAATLAGTSYLSGAVLKMVIQPTRSEAESLSMALKRLTASSAEAQKERDALQLTRWAILEGILRNKGFPLTNAVRAARALESGQAGTSTLRCALIGEVLQEASDGKAAKFEGEYFDAMIAVLTVIQKTLSGVDENKAFPLAVLPTLLMVARRFIGIQQLSRQGRQQQWQAMKLFADVLCAWDETKEAGYDEVSSTKFSLIPEHVLAAFLVAAGGITQVTKGCARRVNMIVKALRQATYTGSKFRSIGNENQLAGDDLDAAVEEEQREAARRKKSSVAQAIAATQMRRMESKVNMNPSLRRKDTMAGSMAAKPSGMDGTGTSGSKFSGTSKSAVSSSSGDEREGTLGSTTSSLKKGSGRGRIVGESTNVSFGEQTTTVFEAEIVESDSGSDEEDPATNGGDSDASPGRRASGWRSTNSIRRASSTKVAKTVSAVDPRQRQKDASAVLLKLCGVAVAKISEAASKSSAKDAHPAIANDDIVGMDDVAALRNAASDCVLYCRLLYKPTDRRVSVAVTYWAFFVLLQVRRRTGDVYEKEEHAAVAEQYHEMASRLHYADEAEQKRVTKTDYYLQTTARFAQLLMRNGEWLAGQMLAAYGADISDENGASGEALKAVKDAMDLGKSADSAGEILVKTLKKQRNRRGVNSAIFFEDVHRRGICCVEWDDRRKLRRQLFTNILLIRGQYTRDNLVERWVVNLQEAQQRIWAYQQLEDMERLFELFVKASIEAWNILCREHLESLFLLTEAEEVSERQLINGEEQAEWDNLQTGADAAERGSIVQEAIAGVGLIANLEHLEIESLVRWHIEEVERARVVALVVREEQGLRGVLLRQGDQLVVGIQEASARSFLCHRLFWSSLSMTIQKFEEGRREELWQEQHQTFRQTIVLPAHVYSQSEPTSTVEAETRERVFRDSIIYEEMESIRISMSVGMINSLVRCYNNLEYLTGLEETVRQFIIARWATQIRVLRSRATGSGRLTELEIHEAQSRLVVEEEYAAGLNACFEAVETDIRGKVNTVQYEARQMLLLAAEVVLRAALVRESYRERMELLELGSEGTADVIDEEQLVVPGTLPIEDEVAYGEWSDDDLLFDSSDSSHSETPLIPPLDPVTLERLDETTKARIVRAHEIRLKEAKDRKHQVRIQRRKVLDSYRVTKSDIENFQPVANSFQLDEFPDSTDPQEIENFKARRLKLLATRRRWLELKASHELLRAADDGTSETKALLQIKTPEAKKEIRRRLRQHKLRTASLLAEELSAATASNQQSFDTFVKRKEVTLQRKKARLAKLRQLQASEEQLFVDEITQPQMRGTAVTATEVPQAEKLRRQDEAVDRSLRRTFGGQVVLSAFYSGRRKILAAELQRRMKSLLPMFEYIERRHILQRELKARPKWMQLLQEQIFAFERSQRRLISPEDRTVRMHLMEAYHLVSRYEFQRKEVLYRAIFGAREIWEHHERWLQGQIVHQESALRRLLVEQPRDIDFAAITLPFISADAYQEVELEAFAFFIAITQEQEVLNRHHIESAFPGKQRDLYLISCVRTRNRIAFHEWYRFECIAQQYDLESADAHGRREIRLDEYAIRHVMYHKMFLPALSEIEGRESQLPGVRAQRTKFTQMFKAVNLVEEEARALIADQEILERRKIRKMERQFYNLCIHDFVDDAKRDLPPVGSSGAVRSTPAPVPKPRRRPDFELIAAQAWQAIEEQEETDRKEIELQNLFFWQICRQEIQTSAEYSSIRESMHQKAWNHAEAERLRREELDALLAEMETEVYRVQKNFKAKPMPKFVSPRRAGRKSPSHVESPERWESPSKRRAESNTTTGLYDAVEQHIQLPTDHHHLQRNPPRSPQRRSEPEPVQELVISPPTPPEVIEVLEAPQVDPGRLFPPKSRSNYTAEVEEDIERQLAVEARRDIERRIHNMNVEKKKKKQATARETSMRPSSQRSSSSSSSFDPLPAARHTEQPAVQQLFPSARIPSDIQKVSHAADDDVDQELKRRILNQVQRAFVFKQMASSNRTPAEAIRKRRKKALDYGFKKLEGKKEVTHPQAQTPLDAHPRDQLSSEAGGPPRVAQATVLAKTRAAPDSKRDVTKRAPASFQEKLNAVEARIEVTKPKSVLPSQTTADESPTNDSEASKHLTINWGAYMSSRTTRQRLK